MIEESEEEQKITLSPHNRQFTPGLGHDRKRHILLAFETDRHRTVTYRPGTSRYRRMANECPRQALDYRSPSRVLAQARTCGHVDPRGHVDKARGIAHILTAEEQKQSV
jgi:hypothetical protein